MPINVVKLIFSQLICTFVGVSCTNRNMYWVVIFPVGIRDWPTYWEEQTTSLYAFRVYTNTMSSWLSLLAVTVG